MHNFDHFLNNYSIMKFIDFRSGVVFTFVSELQPHTRMTMKSDVFPNMIVEDFGMKLEVHFGCPIFISTLMFIFVYNLA